jgi:hypothetical protein
VRKSRSGIANLVGAVFFILIVVLMVGALGTMFGTFNTFVGGQHTSNQQTLQAQQASLNVQDLVFGGQTSYAGFHFTKSGTLTGALNAGQNPILPVTNMNFTGGMQGWSMTQSYSGVTDNATVTNGPQTIPLSSTGCLAPVAATMCFTLVVTNNNSAGSPYQIAKVSVLADTNFAVPSPQPPSSLTSNWGPSRLLPNHLPMVVGNNITWVSAYPAFVLGGGASQPFVWSATLPPTVGIFYVTVVVSWIDVLAAPPNPFTDTAIATVNSTISSTATLQAGTSTAVIAKTPSGQAGGISAGYTGGTTTTSSASGPGSLYFDFEPSVNSAPISDQQQLSGTVTFSTSFYLDTATANNIVASGCCTFSWETSLNQITSVQNPLIFYKVSVTSPAGVTFLLPIGGKSCGASPTNPPINSVNPTILNYFGPGGWVYGHVCFDPNSFLWTEGTYTLAVQVTAIVPGAFADTSGYPPTVSIGLDDIGLALKPAATSYYGSTQTNSPKDFQMPTGLNATMVQGMELVINATGASQNTTIYAYAADNSHSIYNPTPWVQIGSAFFKGSGIIDATISLPNAAYYVNATNYVAGPLTNIRDIDVRVNATSPYGPFTLKITVLAIVQTFNQARITVSLVNQGPSPLHLVSMVVSGPGSISSFPFATNYYVGVGQKVFLPETFIWLPGQVYTVTVTGSTGLTFSRSFTSPLA